MKNNYEARRANRISAYKHLAEKNQRASKAAMEKSSHMASVIPMGQPILVGHHSEKSDRAYRNKISNEMGKSVELEKKADYYADKAAAAESNNAISSDDPNALPKLREKLEDLQRNQETMKAANKYIRAKDKDGFLTIPGMQEKHWNELTEPGRFGGLGFASFSLTNNNANIRRIRERIAALEKLEATTTTETKVGDVIVRQNVEANRTQIVFPSIPSEEIRTELKKNAFKWSRYEGAWQRFLSDSAYRIALRIANMF